MRLKHHYQQMKIEFLEDIGMNILGEESQIWIVRETRPVVENYRYIHDWYYIEDLAENAYTNSDKYLAVKTTVGKVLKELDEWIAIT